MINDATPRQKVLRVLMYMVEHPNGLTRKELEQRLGLSNKAVKECQEAIRSAGFEIIKDGSHRYALEPGKRTEKLSRLLYFTAEEQELLRRAVDEVYKFSDASEILKRKLASIYDYQRLGTMSLRKPYLRRIELLDKAIQEKRCVVLERYRSNNSESVADRLVEPFHLNVPEDIVQAYDRHSKKLRYFRVARMERVTLREEEWQNESQHVIMPADVFRIVHKQQTMVHFRMQVSVYNDLIERFPLTKNNTEPAAEAGWYDFQGDVNAEFIAIGSFLLGHGRAVEVIYPQALRDHLNGEARKLRF